MHPLPLPLEKIIRELDDHKIITGQLIAEYISGVSLNEKDFTDYSSFNHHRSESYGRKLIFENKNYKILIMSWNPTDFTAIHNHDHAGWGCVYFFGKTSHRLYQWNSSGMLEIYKDSYMEENSYAVMRDDLIHLMGNAGKRKLVTLHFYGKNPERKKATVFAPELKKIFTSEGPAFLNMKKELILSEKKFVSIAPYALADYLELVKPYYERNDLHEIVKLINLYIKNPDIYSDGNE